MYGKELILDLHECDPATFTKSSLEKFFISLCDEIDMEREDLHFWADDENDPVETDPQIVGTSAIQFIRTSNITIHCLDLLKKAFVNIFSCKDFDSEVVKTFTSNWFGGTVVNSKEVERV